jgi:hypothetical protein
MLLRFNWPLALFFGLIITVSACKKDDDTPSETFGDFRIELEHKFGAADFAFGTPYTNAAGESLTFSTAKYYISNVVLHKADGTTWSPAESYFLVDAAVPASTILTIEDAPTADYTELEFTIGVDSTRNVSGAQDGALSIANNMFWSWNSGYIFIKMEGSSPQAPGNAFTYHIGGFKSPNNAIQHGHFDFGSSLLKVKPTATPQVHAYVDIAKFFNAEHGGTNLSVATLPTWTMPGANAVMLAGNFHHAFVFDHIHN